MKRSSLPQSARMKQRAIDLGSARVSRAGDGVPPSRAFLSGRARKKDCFGETPNQHARRVRYPDIRSDAKITFHCAMFLSHLECTSCGLCHDWSHLQNLCTACHGPLFAIYHLNAVGHSLKRETLGTREKSLWRYRELLPLPADVDPVSLGEGGTPLLRAKRFADDVDLWIKDESQNPTQSFKARGMSVAVLMAKYLGATKFAAPIEGKKTLGYELAEQFDWKLPDVILYPTGGGTGLIGMWKAFYEMETLGWIGKKRPRMFSVQATGCAPIVRAFEAGEKSAAEFPDAHTIASGLRVPKAIGDFLILKILRESNGGAIAVDDEEMIRTVREVGSAEGLFVAPGGAA